MTAQALYLGFGGHGNLGDDVIRDVIYSAVPRVGFHELAVRRRRVMWRVATGSTWRHRRLPLLVGGGTILGRTLWREHFDRLDRLYRPTTWEMLGAGVEDPEFHGDRSYTTDAELAAWPRILDRFGPVTVRGPRSQAILASVGVDAEVIGDPALLLDVEPWSASTTKTTDILVNVTCGEDQWGGTGLDWTGDLTRTLARPELSSYRVRFLSMEATDDEWIQRVGSGLGGAFEIVRPGTVIELADTLRDASVLVGTRLHSNVIAAAMGMPSISLEYRPKCRDFMTSVGQERFTTRVDEISDDWLLDAINEALGRGSAISSEILGHVDRYRSRLRVRLDEIAAGFGTAT